MSASVCFCLFEVVHSVDPAPSNQLFTVMIDDENCLVKVGTLTHLALKLSRHPQRDLAQGWIHAELETITV
ncbi:hypothetical protein G5V57_04545 [Nordella sp. HKS 07]|uniref:hypothetical protein n=1 Tax=Nordella sp. HKS 07 TaxID=2712222 RepID=UPI0013E19553|nr:hypothetical protein [Nordella sp. HKS 07]QIG47077.1 hypothetical protein G5V57_04545 [Nordella sp. HKS 07]